MNVFETHKQLGSLTGANGRFKNPRPQRLSTGMAFTGRMFCTAMLVAPVMAAGQSAIIQDGNMGFVVTDFGYVLETGRIRLHDTGKNLLANPEVREAYLGG